LRASGPGSKIVSIGCRKGRAMLKASGKLGSYFLVSIAFNGLTHNMEPGSKIRLRPLALCSETSELVLHSR
jgi:hypothetical protein